MNPPPHGDGLGQDQNINPNGSLIKNQIPIVQIKINKIENLENSQGNIDSSMFSLCYKDIQYYPTYLNSETEQLEKQSKFKEVFEKSTDLVYEKGIMINPEALTEIKKIEEINQIQNLPLFKKMYKNFLMSTGCEKFVFLLTFSISLFLNILVFYLFYDSSIKPNLVNITSVQFFCISTNLTVGEYRNILCIIGIGQTSIGIVSIGQISYGVVAIGQMSIGLFTVGQFSVGLFFVLVSQIGIGFFCYVSQFSIAGFYSKMSFLGTSPMKPLLKLHKKPFQICCD